MPVNGGINHKNSKYQKRETLRSSTSPESNYCRVISPYPAVLYTSDFRSLAQTLPYAPKPTPQKFPASPPPFYAPDDRSPPLKNLSTTKIGTLWTPLIYRGCRAWHRGGIVLNVQLGGAAASASAPLRISQIFTKKSRQQRVKSSQILSLPLVHKATSYSKSIPIADVCFITQ